MNTDYITLQCPECGRQKEVLAYRGAKSFSCCAAYVAVIDGVESDNFMLAPGHKTTYRKLVVTHVNPPIPIRTHDWSAHLEGDEEAGAKGWGETRRDAILDLLVELEDKMNEAANPALFKAITERA